MAAKAFFGSKTDYAYANAHDGSRFYRGIDYVLPPPCAHGHDCALQGGSRL